MPGLAVEPVTAPKRPREISVAERTSPERAAQIRRDLYQSPKSVPDHGINLRAGKFPPVKSRDDNLFFVPKVTPPSTRLLERLKAESQGVVPNLWPDERIILHSKCGASFLLVPQLRVTTQDTTIQSELGRVTITEVLRAVSAATGFHVRDIISQRRTADIVAPRQLAMYLCKRLTLKSLPEIGRRMGGKDHTTVLHAVRKMAWLDAALNLAGEIPAIDWAKQGWLLIQEHGAKGPAI